MSISLSILPSWFQRQPVVSVLPLSGVIRAAGGPGRPALSASGLEDLVEAAFKPKRLAAVALAINSPGGSPVQSRLVFSSIRRAAEKRGVPVLAYVEDVAASGGYILALAADEVFADSSSIVGSIGVISAGFGFQQAIARYGIERRVHTAGDSKSQLDPFKAEDPEDIRRLERILGQLHQQFITLVKMRRGEKLKDDPELFSGAFWTADDALEKGLIDGVAHMRADLKKRFGEEVKIVKIKQKSSFLKNFIGVHRTPPSGEISTNQAQIFDGKTIAVDEMVSDIETLALWSRYGL